MDSNGQHMPADMKKNLKHSTLWFSGFIDSLGKDSVLVDTIRVQISKPSSCQELSKSKF